MGLSIIEQTKDKAISESSVTWPFIPPMTICSKLKINFELSLFGALNSQKVSIASPKNAPYMHDNVR